MRAAQRATQHRAVYALLPHLAERRGDEQISHGRSPAGHMIRAPTHRLRVARLQASTTQAHAHIP